MSSSLILTNCLFCGLAALLLLPLLRQPNMLIYKKGIPIFIGIIFIFAKLLIPYEFSFTHTIASKNILPTIKMIEEFYIFRNITIGNLILFIWILISTLLSVYSISRHLKLMRILSMVPEAENKEINQILLGLCSQNHIINKPKVVQLDINTGPLIVGLRTPIIVLPQQLSTNEIRFILLHELEHYKNHHILIKACVEIVTAIYWWNPVIWLLRKAVICAMELQADTNVIQGLSNNARYGYLESLINISKRFQEKHNTNLILSFAFKNNEVEYRVRTALNFNDFQQENRTLVFQFLLLILSAITLFYSSIYTFESYSINPVNVKNTFSADSKTDYFVFSGENYDLYLNGEYSVTISNIPEDLSSLPIHK